MRSATEQPPSPSPFPSVSSKIYQISNLAFKLLTMEVPVTIAGDAFKCIQGTFISGRHKLSTSIYRMTNNAYMVVLQALLIPIPTTTALPHFLPPPGIPSN
ncbi:hypothetical protein L6452_18852 [Arctium lappa]|uniref:Uncharacterized protein n=1 Tax=Arctium lappa TaxID=4217 RepID=A0ACB9C7J5_ARCLA|nr:hypothetical protein L6452_18852 [Arctium lappa]